MHTISGTEAAEPTELILIVDDIPSNLEVISETLSFVGYNVLIAISGERALNRLKRQSPDLILLDVMMPEMDGFETCRRLKEDPATCDIPVIFMTAAADAESKVKGFELGAVDYITKPFQAQEVLVRVKTHLKVKRLSQALKLRNEELHQIAEQLAQRIVDLEAAQEDLIQAEKMAALGQLTASIAHEINTPLGVIRGATENMIAAFNASLQQFPALIQRLSSQQQAEFLTLVNDAIQNPQFLSTQEERQLRQHLQAQLTAEGIDNAQTIAAQFTLLQLGKDFQPYQTLLQAPNCSEILQVAYHLVLQYQSASNIQQEVARAAKIVFALRTYSHQVHVNEQIRARVTDSIEVALVLYHNRFKHGIEVIRNYGDVSEISCNSDELTQVWVNLIDNAVYAMNQQGRLEICVEQQTNQVVVQVTDSGSGMPSEIQTQIFEPFFTTKPRGEGSGLGLDIVRRIVEKHGGSIQVHSQPGRTTFTVRLPLSNGEFEAQANSEVSHE